MGDGANPEPAPTMGEIQPLWRTNPEKAARSWCEHVGLVFTDVRPATGQGKMRPSLAFEVDAVRPSCGHAETFSGWPWTWRGSVDPCPTCYAGVTLAEARAREQCKRFEVEFVRFEPRTDVEGSVDELTVRLECGHCVSGRWKLDYWRQPFCPTCEQETAERWFAERGGQLLTWRPPQALGRPANITANKPCGHWTEGRWPDLSATALSECPRCEIEEAARAWCRRHELELRRCDTAGSSRPTMVVYLRSCGHVEVRSDWTDQDAPDDRCRSCSSPADLRSEWAEEHGVVLTELADQPSASTQITYRLVCGHIQSQSFYAARRRGPRPCRECAPTAQERAAAWCDQHNVAFVSLVELFDRATRVRTATLTYVRPDCKHAAKVPWSGTARTKLESACAECQIEKDAASVEQLTLDLP